MIRNFVLSLFAPALLLIACGNGGGGTTAELPPPGRGEMIFNMHCVLCHGGDGKLGISGAKDLTISPLSRDEMIAVVTNGRGTMMPYRNVLEADEIEVVVDHVLTLSELE